MVEWNGGVDYWSGVLDWVTGVPRPQIISPVAIYFSVVMR